MYFEINLIANKIFLLSKEKNLSIINAKLFSERSETSEKIYQLNKYHIIQLPYFSLNDKINTHLGFDYYIYKINY
jgi:hypothetical protein